jgi:hypothetical protein
MSIQVGNYNAEGPFGNTNGLAARSGVYVILGRSSQASNWIVVDVGESGNVQDRVENYDRKLCWSGRGRSWRLPRFTLTSATGC